MVKLTSSGRLMRHLCFKYQSTLKFALTKDSKHNEPIAPNLLNSKITVYSQDVALMIENA
jgi:hypothetical protein